MNMPTPLIPHLKTIYLLQVGVTSTVPLGTFTCTCILKTWGICIQITYLLNRYSSMIKLIKR